MEDSGHKGAAFLFHIANRPGGRRLVGGGFALLYAGGSLTRQVHGEGGGVRVSGLRKCLQKLILKTPKENCSGGEGGATSHPLPRVPALGLR